MAEMTEKELKDYTRQLLQFMKESAESFDMDQMGEANRIAVCIRTLVQDTRLTKSILSRLGLKDLYVYDMSLHYNPEIDLPFSGIAIVTIGKKTNRYVPRLDGFGRIAPRKVTFAQWWDQTVIVNKGENVNLTRGDIVLGVSNTYFGGLNAKLNEFYNEIYTRRPNVWDGEVEHISEDMISIEFASVRHIAFELLKALEEQIPEYFN